MTANEMAQEFLIGLDTRQAGDTMGYEDDEISLFLNDAIYAIIKQGIRRGLETVEYYRQFTSELKRDSHQDSLSTSEYTSAYSGDTFEDELHPNGSFWTYPDDLWIPLKEYVIVTPDDSFTCKFADNPLIPVKPIEEDYYLSNRSNRNRKPYFDGVNGLVWRLSYNTTSTPSGIPPVGGWPPFNRRVELITSGNFTIDSYHVRYLIQPTAIVVNQTTPGAQVNTEIHDSFHKDIVYKAVEIALENSKNSRFQTRKILNGEQSL